MIVTKETLNEVIEELGRESILAFDTETTGLRPYHGDVPFCATIASKDKEYFFNFSAEYTENALAPEVLLPLTEREDMKWIMCNAKFDMHMMLSKGVVFKGQVCELQAAYRLLNNEAIELSLSAIANAVGLKKSEAVEEYINKHKLMTRIDLPHVKRKRTDKHFDRVPVAVLAPYALQDARVTYDAFMRVNSKLNELAKASSDLRPSVHKAFYQELGMTKVLFDMESRGVLIDRHFCNEARSILERRMRELEGDFKLQTGYPFSKAPSLFKKIFESEQFTFTEKGSPRFDKETLKKFHHPAAQTVVRISNALKRVEYFRSFLYFADQGDVVHTRFNQAGTTTGRLSSAEPNLQNLTKPGKSDKTSGQEEEGWPEVREAIIARDGFFFAMLDYEQIEYRVMLDMAKAHSLIPKILDGLDVHEATANVAGVTRQQAKTVNFLTLYGGGVKKLAAALGCSDLKAREIQHSIFRAAPEIKDFIHNVIRTAETRGYVFNQNGRRYYFSDVRRAYAAPNHLIQGQCSEILKEAMIRCSDYLKDKKSKLVLSIHDELVFEVSQDESHIIEELKKIMETSYRPRYLPLAVDVEIGINLADRHTLSDLAFFTNGIEGRDNVKDEGSAEAAGHAQHMGM